MLRILQSSSNHIEGELRRLAARSGIGAGIRAEQLALTQAAIHRETARMWAALGDQIEAGRAEAAAAAVDSMYPSSLLKKVMPAKDYDYLLRSAKATAARSIETVEARQTLSRIPLAESVWNTQHLTDGKIDTLINDALARGASAAELAADVRAYVRPDTRGGIRYAATRLGRTEINNAFHATQIQEAVKTPWTLRVKWNLSGSHPRPDECNEYADSTHVEGWDAGEWRPHEVPAKPHPNCLCFTTPVTDSEDEFIRKFQSGEYDTFLEEEFDLDVTSRWPGYLPPQPASRTIRRDTDWYDAAYPAELKDAALLRRSQTNVQSLTLRRSDFEGLDEATIDELMADLPTGVERELAGWRAYTGGKYREMNRDLRDGIRTPDSQAYNDAFDAFFDGQYAQTMSEDTVVWRGLRTFDNFDPSEVKVGQYMSDPGWLSASAREETGKGFGDWTLEILLPKGTKYAPGTDYEREVILRKGSVLKIVRRNENDKTLYAEWVEK